MRAKIRAEALESAGDRVTLAHNTAPAGGMPIGFRLPEHRAYVGRRLAEIATDAGGYNPAWAAVAWPGSPARVRQPPARAGALCARQVRAIAGRRGAKGDLGGGRPAGAA